MKFERLMIFFGYCSLLFGVSVIIAIWASVANAQYIQLDSQGYYIGETARQWAGAIEAPKPVIPQGKRAKWVDGEWLIKSEVETLDDYDLTQEEFEDKSQRLYETTELVQEPFTYVDEEGEEIKSYRYVCPEGYERNDDGVDWFCQRFTGYAKVSQLVPVLNEGRRQERLDLQAQKEQERSQQQQDNARIKRLKEILIDELGRNEQGQFVSDQQFRNRVRELSRDNESEMERN